MRVALYVRVSTEEQKLRGLSVDSQIEALQEYAKENNHVIVGVYNDAGISARKTYKKRPALLQLIKDCESKKIDLILFTKLDRWFRSVADYYDVQRQLEKYHVPWRTIWEDYETITSAGMFKVNIMLSVAQSESDRTSERIKAVNEYRRMSGDVYVGGKAPTGYIKQNRGLVVDENMREGLQAFFNEYLNSFSLDRAIKTMRAEGIQVTRQTATRMLKNSAYCGNASGYKCEAFITEEQHNLIVKSCATRSVRATHDPSRVYYFTGLARCGACNGTYSGTVRSMKSGKKTYLYKYYRCHQHKETGNCQGTRSMSEMKIERYLLENLDRDLACYNLKARTASANMSNYTAEISRLKQKLERIGERFEDGDIDRDEYREKRQTVLSRIGELEDLTKNTEKEKTLPASWREVYSSLDDAHKRAFWHSIIDKIIIYKDERIEIKFI